MPSKQRDAKRSIPYKGDTPSRPALHPDLTHAVEIKLLRPIKVIEDVGAFPFPLGIFLAQHCFLQVERRGQGTRVGGKKE